MGLICWFSGLSGSGKTTIARAVKIAWQSPLLLLDGDVLREGLNRDLGFTPAERQENLRRAAEVACLTADLDIPVVAALITPTLADRALVTSVIAGRHRICWVYVATPLEECERRDTKGLYRRARSGALNGFTGISAPFDPFPSANLIIDTSHLSISDACRSVLSLLKSYP